MTVGDSGDDSGIDTSKWSILYPNYLNSKKSRPQGRRIATANAVEHPHPAEMAEICEYLKIPHVLEMHKSYPRDWLIRGRVRVLLKTPEGAFTNAEVHTKEQLLLKMGELIPKLKSRAPGAAQEKFLAMQAAASGMTSSTPTGSQSRDARKEAKAAQKKAEKKKK
eukprot:gnl/TRDRNA2_/TRDRNA2_178728_c0_seq1.p1 gnl/TRDRNA2_/TRDRNA2_178728_c0~~gnl/TRDRNA2_/TRDRNA2_178728_c0_seq1.p1  ORF type:complete len:165 (+),score=43.12 gnl/TRDRNA2_/TRDRNA2_178728_c0_seq1:92-586(+)